MRGRPERCRQGCRPVANQARNTRPGVGRLCEETPESGRFLWKSPAVLFRSVEGRPERGPGRQRRKRFIGADFSNEVPAIAAIRGMQGPRVVFKPCNVDFRPYSSSRYRGCRAPPNGAIPGVQEPGAAEGLIQRPGAHPLWGRTAAWAGVAAHPSATLRADPRDAYQELGSTRPPGSRALIRRPCLADAVTCTEMKTEAR